MQYRTDKKGNKISILGYGCMRFTTKAGAIDIDKAEKEIMTYKGRDRNFEIAKILNDYEADLTGKMRKSWE